MKLNLYNRGQILLITLFILGVSMIIVIASFFSINEQIRRIRKMFESYYSYSLAESGIEISSYYHLKSQEIPSALNIFVSSEENLEETSKCKEFYNFTPDLLCAETIINRNDYSIKTLTHSVIKETFTTDILATRVISYGNYKNTSRILIFNFYLSNQNNF